jgi:DNA topoisomerase-1
MVVKKGKYGPFLACSGYPECKNTRPLNGNGQVEDLALPEGMDPVCSKCGADLTVKRSRQGSLFIACTNYPKCKNTMAYPTGVKCPKEECDGEVVERSSRRGIFYGCSNYPKCRLTLRSRPVNQACPDCGSPYLIEAPTKDSDGTSASDEVKLKCPNKKCDYTTTLKEDRKA